MRIVLLLFLAICLTVMIMVIFASFNLIYCLWYISAFLMFLHGMFLLRDIFVDKQADREEGKCVQHHWWRKDNPMLSVLQVLGLCVVCLGGGIIKLGTTSPSMSFDYLRTFIVFLFLFPSILMMFDVLARVYGRMKIWWEK